ncbi:MAG TPA: hypothetical protein VKG38_09845, partial [Solirubrobacteraceae bacterium]|nr:hypothetical protein [Solirubrobacteraceae bacterium]
MATQVLDAYARRDIDALLAIDDPTRHAPNAPCRGASATLNAELSDDAGDDRLMMSAYPAHREVDVTLRDGSTVRVRPIRAEDR